MQFLCLIKVFSQELNFEDGLYIEKPIFKDSEFHNYTSDNNTFKLNKVFKYKYEYNSKDGKRFKLLFQRQLNHDNPLGLVSEISDRNSLINEIEIKVTDEREEFTNDSSYTQTVICYNYLNKKGLTSDTVWDASNFSKPGAKIPCNELTGVVDNSKNIFLHPPRQSTFKILELSPFPMYYLDESVKSWQWNVVIGSYYLDPRWISAKGKITAHYFYTRQSNEFLQTAFGQLECKVIQATGTSDEKELNTKLKSYFHPNYGFVRLEYVNVDGSKIILELIECK